MAFSLGSRGPLAGTKKCQAVECQAVETVSNFANSTRSLLPLLSGRNSVASHLRVEPWASMSYELHEPRAAWVWTNPVIFLTTVLRLKSSAISGNYWSKHHCITQKNLRTVSHFSQSFNAGGHLLRGPLRNHWKDGGFTRKCFRTCWYTLHIGKIERWKMCKWWLFYFLCKHLQENKCEVQVEVKRKRLKEKTTTSQMVLLVICSASSELDERWWKEHMKIRKKKNIYIYNSKWFVGNHQALQGLTTYQWTRL